MKGVVTATTSVSFEEHGSGQELTLALQTGEKIKSGIYVHLTPVVDATIGCTDGSLSGGETITEKEEPQYIQWSGNRYGLAEGDVEVSAVVYKVFEGEAGPLTVDQEKLEIISKTSWLGIAKLTKKNQNKRYLWIPSNINEESEAVVWAFYEGKTGVDGSNVTKTADGLLKKSMATTTVSWPPDADNYPISLSVGKQDNDAGCVYIYQTPNVSAVERGTDIGSLESVGEVNTKEKDIYVTWDGTSIQLPSGVVECTANVYKVYEGSPGQITVNLADEICTTKDEWVGIAKLTTTVESKKLRWIPPDVNKRTQAVVHAYRRGSVSMTNVEWVPEEDNGEIRIELDSSSSEESSKLPLMEILLRLYPANREIEIGCTEGGVGKGQIVSESKEKYLEFKLVPLPDIGKLSSDAWEPDDDEDSAGYSKTSLGKSCLDVTFRPIDCFDRAGESVTPTITYDQATGNAIGDRSFYGLVKATYKEEYLQILYQQAYRESITGAMDILTGYVYAFYNNKSAFCEVPWDTNVKTDTKVLYEVFSYFVSDIKGTWEYPDNWLTELERETTLRKWTRDQWDEVIESREPGTFEKDPDASISPTSNSIQERIHRTATYNWLGNVITENHQPVRGHYFKPYTDVRPKPDSSYTPKYFVRFGGKPDVYDNVSEFGEEKPSFEPEKTGLKPRYIPTDSSLGALKKAWESTYSRFNFNEIYKELKKEFPGLIRVPDENGSEGGV